MTFDSVFANIAHGETAQLLEKHHESMEVFSEEPFYVKPTFDDMETKKGASILIISAPGAMGKSALAKYLAYQYHAIYWNLADITLGDNSFVGTLVTSVGAENYSTYMSNLINGKTSLIIDAFDEAEMISGLRSVDKFLYDIANSTNKAVCPCIILLSRAETAQHISKFYQEQDILFNMFDINAAPRANTGRTFSRTLTEKLPYPDGSQPN